MLLIVPSFAAQSTAVALNRMTSDWTKFAKRAKRQVRVRPFVA